MPARALSRLQVDFVHVAPSPILAPLVRLDDRVLSRVKVLGGVLVLGVITAADVAADHAKTKMNPGIAHLQAFLAAFTARRDLPYLI